MSEIWKPIKGYETHYEVSSHGRVKALYREFVGKDGKIKKYHERFLKPDTSEIKRGYMRITLSKDYKTQRFLVHRLVAEHFIPNPENKPFINHIDNNGLNNHISNLEWCTHSENMLHAQKQGRLFNSQSKGGLTQGENSKQKRAEYIQSLIGTVKNNWKVKRLDVLDSVAKTRIICECLLCNSEKSISFPNFRNNLSNCCAECSWRIRRESNPKYRGKFKSR